jgi:hypothetical protein
MFAAVRRERVQVERMRRELERQAAKIKREPKQQQPLVPSTSKLNSQQQQQQQQHARRQPTPDVARAGVAMRKLQAERKQLQVSGYVLYCYALQHSSACICMHASMYRLQMYRRGYQSLLSQNGCATAEYC